MVSRLILPVVILACLVSSMAYAQTGPIVPSGVSTQAHYCFNGTCSTGALPSIPSNYSLSTHKLPVLLISLSGTCETLVKQGSKDCPTIKDLMTYDTSNQYVSGKFVNNNGLYHREPPQVKNNWLSYSYGTKQVTCVECTFDILSSQQSQQIIINPTGFTYINKTAIAKNSWVSWSDRYMQGCDVATIGYSKQLLNDTISYMLSGCTKTGFNSTQSHVIPDKPWEYKNPYSTLHQITYLKDILHDHNLSNTNHTSGGSGPMDCIRHQCSFIDPYKKAGW